MIVDEAPGLDQRVLILAPTARDAEATRKILASGAIDSLVCHDLGEVCDEIRRGCGAALLTQEAILADRDGCLAEVLQGQPPWSDIPLVVLTPAAAESAVTFRALDAIGHMTPVRRPVQIHALLSTIRAALRDRTRQYQTRRYIAEREAQAEAIRRRDAEFRQIADSMPQMVWTARPDGHVDYYNQRWFEYTGQAPGVTGDPSWAPMLHPDDLDDATRTWTDAVRDGQPLQVECRFRERTTGAYRWHLCRALPIHDPQGQISRWFGTCTDIDDHKRGEARLRQAKDAAEAAISAKNRFIAMLSHELRTPLTPILLLADTMQVDPDLGDDQRAAWRSVFENISLESRLIDDLLDVMRTISGKMSYQFEIVDAHDLIAKAVQVVRAELVEKQIDLALDLHATRHHVRADPARLTQAFWNLLKNSVKFSEPGRTITIRTRDTGGRLAVEVEDQGIGIEPAALDKIFNAFEQVEDSVTRRFGGLGLGLAITKSVVEAHGGRLSARSPGPGLGATFVIELAPATPDIRQAAPDDAPHAREDERRPLDILFVEDDPMTCRVMGRLLRNAGYSVTTATCYDEALKVASSHFDLVISDVGLPDRSGFDLMRELKARHNLPGIAVTGFGTEADVRRAHESGFSDHVTKPVEFRKLDEVIRRVTST